jgi:hypothetical protein
MIGSIYKISSPNCIECYGGSTTKSLNHRFLVHKHISNKCKSKYIIDKGDAIIELIEEYECNTIQDLRKREQQIINQQIEQGHILVNIKNAYTSPEDRKEYLKQWRINNPNYMKEYCKNWREINLRTN